jgi:NADH:ubiquinone oxidoreductase subunit E
MDNNHAMKTIDSAVEKYGGKKEALLSIMHEIQKMQGSISEDTARYLSSKLDIPVSQVFSAATFYRAFSTDPRGKHHIKVCTGTSCYLRASEKIFERIGRELSIAGEGVSEDGEFSVEKVRCMGCCNAGPVMSIDEQIREDASAGKIPDLPREEIIGEMTHYKATTVIKKYREDK